LAGNLVRPQFTTRAVESEERHSQAFAVPEDASARR
jgi:hypothetical protein